VLVAPSELRTIVRVAIYEAPFLYLCDGFWTVDVPPSPNVQDHDVGEPVDASWNTTLPLLPLSAKVNAAVNGAPAVI
jgi:hypothetical protein